MIRRYLFLFLFLAAALIAALFLRIGYMYNEVGRGISANDSESPTIFYGRPLEIRKGDHLGNRRIIEQLTRLSYKEVPGKPYAAGTFSREPDHLRIFLHDKGIEERYYGLSPLDIVLSDNRVVSIASAADQPLESVRLEPEEIGRIMNPKLESRHQIPLSAVSPYLQNAVIASEDARFYSHFGIDIFAIGRAILADLREKRYAEGGSTITQQLAKNFFLSPQKTIARKLREMELALVLEMRYSKKQILEMYLNKIYLGQTGSDVIYGVEDAASVYFSKCAKDLSLEEAALLAGIIHAPNRYDLVRNPKAAKERRDRVLARMKKLGMIPDDEARRASEMAVQIKSGMSPVHMSSYFIDYIERITRAEMGNERIYHTGYRYYTTLDPVMQTAAEEAVAGGLADIEKKARRASEPLQAALVAVDPKTGAMIAMVGGRSYAQSRFNRAVNANRQPGSAFKPFVLLAALTESLAGRQNITLSTMVSGETITLPTLEGTWTPSNYADKQYDKITIRKMIEDSINTATVRLADDIGLQEVLKTARLAGIKSPLLPVPSMPLGSFEVTPMELAYAYTTLASGGIRFEPFPLFSVTEADGEAIITGTVKSKQEFDPRITYLTGYALEGVLERGTAFEAKTLKIDFPVAGKTGTTNGNRDSWFVSYTPDVVCAVWVGYDSGADTGLTGAAGALRINARFLRALYSQAPPPAVVMPEGIEKALIDPTTGYLATVLCPQTFQEAYLAGTAPTETCPEHWVNPVNAIRSKMHDAAEFFKNLFK